MAVVRSNASSMSDLADISASIRRLGVLGEVLADDVGVAYVALLAHLVAEQPSEAAVEWAHLFHLLATEAELYPDELVGDAWQNHLLDRLIAVETPLSLKAQRASPEQLGAGLLAQTRRDLATLQRLHELSGRILIELTTGADGDGASADWSAFSPLRRGASLHGPAGRELKLRFAAASDWSNLADDLAAYYFAEGSGLFGRYRVFRWARRAHAGHLEGIAHPDPIRLEDLIGYEREREPLLQNTEQFLDGYPGNNVLLYGDRGTGKSSTIKALLHAYAERGLRLIEVPKQYLADFPYILAQLRGRRERWVIFVDDLSFDEHETIYKELKAVLEGSLEARPENVLVYATSNRRHLVVERFSDHDAPADAEIHSMDTVQEKLSLSDRFGLRLFFLSPDQERYLEIVRGLASRRSLKIDPDDLERRALQWATSQNGRGGRTARQFIDHLTGQLARQWGLLRSTSEGTSDDQRRTP